MIKNFLILMLAAVMVVALAACGGSDTPLQDYLDAHSADIQAELDSIAHALGEGSRATLTANDANNEVIFSLYFGDLDDMDSEEIAAFAAVLSGMLRPELQPMAVEIRDDAGVDSLILTVKFLARDGSEITSIVVEA